jgi:hypothetical protein
MSTIRSLELSDRPIIEAFLKRYPPEISELTFSNLFVWLNSRSICFAEVDDSIVFVANTAKDRAKQKVIFGQPVGEASPLVAASSLDVQVAGFVRIAEQTADPLREAGLHVEADRDNSDYVYRTTDLAELSGRRFHKKRNLVKQCLTAYSCEYEPITLELINECSEMQDRWCRDRECGRDPSLCDEYVAIGETFAHYQDLGLIGGAIRVDGIIQAYSIAEELSPGTAVCHFEKAMPGFRGLSQLVNKWFAKFTLSEFEFVNREQDLGIPGLRQAKESYYPNHMVHKFNAWFSSASSQTTPVVEPQQCDKDDVN